MKKKFTQEVIFDRISQFHNRDFRVTAHNNIFYTKSENEALRRFNSEDSIALVLFDEQAGSLLQSEMIVAYKEGEIPPDFYHLMYTRNIYASIGEMALEEGKTIDAFKFLYSDLNACSSFFSCFYRYCPELIDDRRLSIQRKISELCEAKLFHDYNRITELCDEVVAEINLIIRNLNISTNWMDMMNFGKIGG
jgi:hypothetical protein